MKKLLFFVYCTLGQLLLVAQISLPRLSPLQKVEQRIGLTDVTIEYSRPSKKGRIIFGGLEPYGKVWRTGANRSTKVTFSNAVAIGDSIVAAGTYSLLTRPMERSWDVYFYKDLNLWGAPDSLEQSKVVAHVNVPSIQLSRTIESLTISVDDLTKHTANLGISWENTYVAVPIKVFTTKRMNEEVQQALTDNALGYHLAGYYYLQENVQLEKAKEMFELSISLSSEPDYRDYLQLAYALDKLNDREGAIEASKKSLVIAQNTGSKRGVEENTENLKKWGVSLSNLFKK